MLIASFAIDPLSNVTLTVVFVEKDDDDIVPNKVPGVV